MLGPCWGHLGAISVVLGPMLASPWAAEAFKNVENASEVSQKREGGDVNSMWLRRLLFDLNVLSSRGRPEPSWDRLGSSSGQSWAILVVLGGILGPSLGQLGLLGAILGPSRRYLGQSSGDPGAILEICFQSFPFWGLSILSALPVPNSAIHGPQMAPGCPETAPN